MRASGGVILIATAALGALALGFGGWMVFGRRMTPQERERLRRLKVNAAGRICDAVVVEIRDGVVYYTYTVHGVDYTASQDVRTLRQLLPADLVTLASHAAVKYLPENPANSILLCEAWSGLYTLPPAQ